MDPAMLLLLLYYLLHMTVHLQKQNMARMQNYRKDAAHTVIHTLGAPLPPSHRFIPHNDAIPPTNDMLIEMTVSIRSKDTSSFLRCARCILAKLSVASVRSFRVTNLLRA